VNLIKVQINNAVVPIPECTSGPGSSCPFKQFVTYVDKERAAIAGDFIKICGLEGVSNATAKVDFFGNVPSTDAGSVIMELPIAP